MRFVPMLLLLSQNPSTELCTFLPENNLSIPTTKIQGIDEAQYNEVIDKVEKVYSPLIQRSGKKLKINRLWTNDRVNAGTYLDGDTYVVNMYGGFARHEATTMDGYALVLCHEIGHHIGGGPKKGNPTWSSTEGQSDYFATLKCLRKVFAKEDNIAAIEGKDIPELVKDKCETAFPTKHEIAMCIRTTLAGMDISRVSADTRREGIPGVNSPDQNIVDTTYEAHPKPQCRLDTYFQGSICEVSSYRVLSRSNEAQGTCHEKNGHTEGLRPTCWFKASQR